MIHQKFIQALPSDNPYLSPQYIDVLKDTFKHRPELLEAYLYGSWDALEGADQVIKSQWVREAAERTLYWPSVKKLLCCDCARFGDDETVIYYLENTEIIESVIRARTRSTDISNRLAVMSHAHDDCSAAVEAVGADLGAAVVDELTELGVNVIVFNPSAKASESDKYYNLRVEVWDYVARLFADGDVQLKNSEPTLTGQLCTPIYKFKRGRLLIEAKEDIKRRLGRSPDRADALVIGYWALQWVEAKKRKDKWAEKDEPVSAMAM